MVFQNRLINGVGISRRQHIGLLISKFSAVIQPMLSSNEINDFTIKQYKRELERYGERTMDLSETIFNINSICVASYLRHIGRGDTEIRKFFGAALINEFLTAFELSFREKLSFFQRNRDAFAKQFS
jgi:thiopeptide-type bacteriocin biosynthesis protein